MLLTFASFAYMDVGKGREQDAEALRSSRTVFIFVGKIKP